MSHHPLPKNPYDILGLAREASAREVRAAKMQALKAKRYSSAEIAAAIKALSEPETRLVADFLQPVLPVPKRLKRDAQALATEVPSLEFLSQYDTLDATIARLGVSEKDQSLA